MSVSIKDLSSLIFGFDDEEVREARAFHIRRPGSPQADMPHMIIPPRVAAGLLAIAGAENIFHIQEHAMYSGKVYYTLWQRQLWLESAEKRFLSSRAWETIRENYFKTKELEQVAQTRAAYESWRFHTMAVRFRSIVRSMKISDCRAIIDRDFADAGSEERFRSKISQYETAARITIYVPPYEEAQVQSDPSQDRDSIHEGATGSEEDPCEGTQSTDLDGPCGEDPRNGPTHQGPNSDIQEGAD